jgi:hypothetical protein
MRTTRNGFYSYDKNEDGSLCTKGHPHVINPVDKLEPLKPGSAHIHHSDDPGFPSFSLATDDYRQLTPLGATALGWGGGYSVPNEKESALMSRPAANFRRFPSGAFHTPVITRSSRTRL